MFFKFTHDIPEFKRLLEFLSMVPYFDYSIKSDVNCYNPWVEYEVSIDQEFCNQDDLPIEDGTVSFTFSLSFIDDYYFDCSLGEDAIPFPLDVALGFMRLEYQEKFK